MLEYKVGRLETALTDHLSRVEGTLKRQEELANKQTKLVNDVVKEVTQQESTYAGKVKGTCEEFFAKVSSKIDSIPKTPKPTSSSPVSDLSGMFTDFMDKDRRKLNVVVHNLPESESDNQAVDDAAKFQNIIKEELKLIVKSTKAFRVGKRGERPRLLIVSLENMETKLEVLKLASQLRKSPTWSNIYVTKDMTWKEREELRKAKAELARRRENGEENLMIKGLKVVKRETRAHAQRQDDPNSASATTRQPAPQGDLDQAVPQGDRQVVDGDAAVTMERAGTGGTEGGTTALPAEQAGTVDPVDGTAAHPAVHAIGDAGTESIVEQPTVRANPETVRGNVSGLSTVHAASGNGTSTSASVTGSSAADGASPDFLGTTSPVAQVSAGTDVDHDTTGNRPDPNSN